MTKPSVKMSDVEYFNRNLFNALKLPREYLRQKCKHCGLRRSEWKGSTGDQFCGDNGGTWEGTGGHAFGSDDG